MFTFVLLAGYSPHAAKKVAFFVGLTQNFGPVTEHTDIIFDRVITNIGGAFEQKTGRFTAPYDGVYQFNVIVSAQGRRKVLTDTCRHNTVHLRVHWRRQIRGTLARAPSTSNCLIFLITSEPHKL